MKYFSEVDLPIFNDLNLELNNLNLEWHKPDDPLEGEQICLNSAEGYTDDYHFGSGYFVRRDVPEGFMFVRGDKEVPLSTSSIRHWKLCDVFKDTVFEQIYDLLHYNFIPGRIRFIKTKPRTCMGWHKDPIPRLHYPIVTEPGCVMVIEDEVYHLPLNKWTKAFTHKGNHTIANGGHDDRIHLVIDLLPPC